jgi:AcrR family transcriptional regulator
MVAAVSKTKARLTPEDWAQAALDSIAEGGLSSVAVEALAPKVGASKGSFYWHFQDRAALLEATFALWEKAKTEAIIEELDGIADPRRRLRRLFAIALSNPRAGRIEAVLSSQAHPQGMTVLRRVTTRRVEFLTGVFADLGFDPAAARRRALMTYTVFLGLFSLRQSDVGIVPTGAALDDYVEGVLDTLTRP